MTPVQVRARSASRTSTLLVAAGVSLGCSDATGPLSPAHVVGTYTIQTVQGHELPWADTSATDLSRSQEIVYGDQMTLRPDSVVVDVFRYATRTDLRVRADTDATGRWVLDPPGLPAGSPHVVRISYYIPGHPPDYAHGIPEQPTYSYAVDYRVDAGGRRLQNMGSGYAYPDVWAR